jgi:hypothetical protein
MSVGVQLEIMRAPLIEELKRTKLPIWVTTLEAPEAKKPKDLFGSAELIMATQAFASGNPQITAAEEAESILENEDFDFAEVDDVLKVFKFVATDLHPTISKIYQDDINKRYLLSNSGVFFMGFCAACGHFRTRNNMKMLQGALDKVIDLAKADAEDPFKLEDYFKAIATITSARGRTNRRLVYDTFLRFFMGATDELEWLTTVAMMAGA